ncbi:MAG: PilZ domain-containing protein [Pyrinomonadaceae bacterium]
MSKTSSKSETEHRTSERAATDIQAIIQFKESSDETWKEVTNLSSISKSGCSFELTRPCPVGRLVTIVTPLPEGLRAYDDKEPLYPVIGLIQHCYEVTAEGETLYRLGAAFVGKSFPDSYKADPLQNYHICGTNPTGLWRITESGKKFQVRNASRFWITMDVTITWIQTEKRSHSKEETVTMNISATGASVLSSLNVKVGDRLKFASKKHDFYTIGIVRNRRDRTDKLPIIHLEFIDRRFPVEKLSVPNVSAVTDLESEDPSSTGAGRPDQTPSYPSL